MHDLLSGAGRLLEGAVDVRRRIHSNPELGLDLPATQQIVLEELDAIGLAGRTGVRCSSVVAELDGPEGGPSTLLRADMDALEMPEDTGLPYASKAEGRMHACGHDAHVAMLLGAARLLAERRDRLPGRVVLMFQPGEEGHDGAKTMLEEGLLEDHGPFDRAFALHISSLLPSGWLACRPGPMLASADEFHITVTGRGGHASMPHDAVDPLPAACEIVTAVQSMVTRRVPAFDPAVVTVSTIHGGTATNVIPERVVLGGTVRAVSDRSRDLVLGAVAEVASHVAAAHRCEASFDLEPHSYPVTVNDETMAARVLSVAEELVGGGRAVVMPSPVMGAEDWSYVLRRVPGAMAFLGAAPPGVAQPAPNHSNRFVIDEEAMTVGIAMHAAMALSSSGASA
jgi:amidohydrolase